MLYGDAAKDLKRQGKMHEAARLAKLAMKYYSKDARGMPSGVIDSRSEVEDLAKTQGAPPGQ